MSTQPASLARVIGPIMGTAIVVGTIIGSGVFKKPAAIAEALPYSGIVALVWIIGGLLVLFGALAYAEVAVLFPQTGGNYVFLREAYGRLAGFLWGWVEFWIIRSASLAALASIFAESLGDIVANPAFQQAVGLPADVRLGYWGQRLLTVATLLGLGAVNIRGVRWGGGLQVGITAIKVGSIAGIIVLPFFFLVSATPPPGGVPPSWDNLAPVWPASITALSLTGLGSAFLGVLWPYHGWMNLAPVAGEVRNPQRNLPLALLLGVGIVVLLYLGSNLAYYLMVPGADMAALRSKDTAVATAYALRLLGPLGAAAASAAIMCSVFGSLNGNLLVGPRLLFAMSNDGLAPRLLSRIHPRWHTPAAAIAVLAIWASLQVLAVAALTEFDLLDRRKSHFDMLTDFAMFGAIIFETMAVLSIYRFRYLLPDAPRPYRCPGYPVVPALHALVPAFVLVNMFLAQLAEAATGLGFILVGVLVYFVLGLQRSRPA
ncbi:MAG: amino acid permease [Gemmataceae bacterium]